MIRSEVTGDDVLRMYVLEKNNTRKAHGLDGVDADALRGRLRVTWLPACEKAAAVCNAHHIAASLWVTACFRYARSKGHASGPLPNCLGSSKYGTNALAYMLQLPLDVVLHQCSDESILRNRDKLYDANCEFLSERLGDNTVDYFALAAMTAVSAVDRLFFANMRKELCGMILQEAITELETDITTRLWAEQKGWAYDDFVGLHNTNIR